MQDSDDLGKGDYMADGVSLGRRCVSAYMIEDPVAMFDEVKEELNPAALQAAVVYLASAYGKLIKKAVVNPDQSWSDFLLSVYNEEEIEG